ncbi:MAG: enoyl-CoA hydratase/isomerase family protein [Pseudomonadota bacterium]
MATLALDRKDNVHVLTLVNGDRDNTFNLEVLAEWNAAFDTISAGTGDASLLIRCEHPKTFCNGIDLQWLMKQPPETVATFVRELENLLLRVATLNLPVVAAINGNAYAGGALLANACDFRLMRADRGRLCYSEINIRMAFTPVMFEIARLQHDAGTVWEMTMTGRALGGEECAQRRVVDRALPLEQLDAEAMKLAMELATKHRPTYTQLKRGLRTAVVALARERGVP